MGDDQGGRHGRRGAVAGPAVRARHPGRGRPKRTRSRRPPRPFVDTGWVVPALAYMAAERLRPGRVVHLAGNRILVPAGEAEARLADVTRPDLAVRGVEDMPTAAWRKLLGNLVANPITTLTLRRIGVMQDPGIEELARGLLVEAVEVGRAEGARLRHEDVTEVLEGTRQYGDRTGSSMLYDRLAGHRLEHQYLTGEVVRRAETHGIPVPLNAAILALLDALDRARRLVPRATSRANSRRPSRARPSVSSSAYSRSPPTGRPLAMRVTLTGSDLEQRRQVQGGGVALDVGVGAQDHLGDALGLEAGEQLPDPQLVRPDPVDGADGALQDVVAAAVLPGLLHRHDVPGLLDHAHDGLVPPGVPADVALGAGPASSPGTPSAMLKHAGTTTPVP